MLEPAMTGKVTRAPSKWSAGLRDWPLIVMSLTESAMKSMNVYALWCASKTTVDVDVNVFWARSGAEVISRCTV